MDAISDEKRQCIKTYGVVSDPTKPQWHNTSCALRSLPTHVFLQSPTNLQCHNLCQTLTPPPGYNYLLGLGLNFCIEQARPKPNIERTFERLKQTIRLKQWLTKNGINQDDEYIPSLYIQSNWNPPEASSETEDAINRFSTMLAIELANNKTNARSNLTRLQYNCLQLLKNGHHFIICLSDKNLRPVIMERNTYFERCFTEHLNCRTTYQQLEKTEALDRVRQTCITLNYIRLHLCFGSALSTTRK